jgi:hypothetical protein
VADFPHTTLGYPLITGYGFAPAAAADRIQPLRGPPIFRFRQATPPERFTVQWRMTERQLQTFRYWLHVTSDRLNDWFTMDLAVGRGAAGVRLLEERTVHFVEPPSFELDGVTWIVTATLDAQWVAPTVPTAFSSEYSVELDLFTSQISVDGSGGDLDVTDDFSLIMWMRIVSKQPWSTNYFDKGNEATFNFKQSANQEFRMDIQSRRDDFSTSTDFRQRIRDGRFHIVGMSWTQGENVEVVVDGVERTPDGLGNQLASTISDTLSAITFEAGVNTGSTATTSWWRLYRAYWYTSKLSVAEMQAMMASENFSDGSLVMQIEPGSQLVSETASGLGVTSTDVAFVLDSPTGDSSPNFVGADILHLTGQSLAEGTSTGGAVTPIPVGASNRWQTNDDQDGFQQIEAGANAEGPFIGMCWGWQIPGGSPVVCATNALSGQRMDQIDKPSGTYTKFLTAVATIQSALARPQKYVAIINGETDETDETTESTYEDVFEQWLSDIDNDIRAATAQPQPVYAIVSQVSRQVDGVMRIAKAQYDVCKNNARAVLAHAKYHHGYVDNVHLDPRSSKMVGVSLARVARELEAGVAWQPLWPTAVAVDGNDIRITMNVPSGSMVKDTTTIPAQTNDGFEYLNGGGEAITGVAIDGNDIVVTLDGAPDPAASIAYAYSSTVIGAGVTGSARGNIRTNRAIFATLDVTYAASQSVTVTINGTDFTVSCDTDDATTAQALVDAINAGSEPVQAEKDLAGFVSIFASDRRTTFTFASSATGAADIDARVEWDWLVHFVEPLT